MRLYVGLVHYPVYNKNHQIIASAITTFDLHDTARVARTYDVSALFVVTPLAEQRVLAERVCRHWTRGYGAKYNPDRKKAIERIRIVSSLEEAVQAITIAEGEAPLQNGNFYLRRGRVGQLRR